MFVLKILKLIDVYFIIFKIRIKDILGDGVVKEFNEKREREIDFLISFFIFCIKKKIKLKNER